MAIIRKAVALNGIPTPRKLAPLVVPNPSRIPSLQSTTDIECLWAKSSPTGGLPLIRHMLDVAAVAATLLHQLPDRALGSRAGHVSLDPEEAARWFTVLVGCHDLGKATPGFQAKWGDGRSKAERAGFDFPTGAPDRHDAATGCFLKRQLRAHGLGNSDAKILTEAVAAHHGFAIPSTEEAAHGRLVLDARWRDAHRDLFDEVLRAVGASGVPRVVDDQGSRADLYHWLAGLCSTADWIGSSERFFPHDRPRTEHGVWFRQSLELARIAVRECGLASAGGGGPTSVDGCMRAALPPGALPRPLQITVATALTHVSDEKPVLLVIEAPMGEGKTEAAFAADAWFRHSGNRRGIYVAMPTQATSNALYGRLAAYVDRLGLAGRSEVQLAHGAAGQGQARLRLREIGFDDSKSTVGASEWLAGSKRTMLAPNAVGTVDQSLVSVLNAKHHFVRYFGLADRTVVLDEIHAYDTYTSGLIERLIAWLLASGSNVIVMSATLPEARRNRILRLAAGTEPPEFPPYPRVTFAADGRIRSFPFAARQAAEVALEPFGVDAIDVAVHACGLAGKGACVLVLANKVSRAQEIYEAVAARTEHSALFHARFPMEQRLGIETSVLRRFGVHGAGREGWVLVATQVAEQSLDVDFDILITDIAPIDLLLQRIGRIHRHTRSRPPGFEEPTAYICGLSSRAEELPPPELTRSVYDRLTILRTAFWLHDRRKLCLPDDIDRGVQWVYGESPIVGVVDAVSSAHESARQELVDMDRWQREIAERAVLSMPDEWIGPPQTASLDDDASSDGLARFGTRLGESSVKCIPIHRLPDGWSVLGDRVDWQAAQSIPPEVAKRLANRYIRVSHRALVAHLVKQSPPSGWDGHSGLPGTWPLILDASGEANVAPLFVRLDSRLGLVIRYRQKQGTLDA